MMADSYEPYKRQGVDDLIAQVSEEVLLQKIVERGRSWTGPASTGVNSIRSEARATSLRNGLSARDTNLRSTSCRFSSRQGDIVRALQAREQNRSFGRHGDISKALEARKQNRVSIQRGPARSSAVEKEEREGRAVNLTTDVEVPGENAHVRFQADPVDCGNVLLSKAVGTSVHPPAFSQQEAQCNPTAPTATVAAKEHRKSNLKSSSLKATASSTEDKTEAPRGRVLILTSALGETRVSTPPGPAEGISGSDKLQAPSSVGAAVSTVVLDHDQGLFRGRAAHSARLDDHLQAGVVTVGYDGSRAPIDRGDGLPEAVTCLDEMEATGSLDIGEEKHFRVPPEEVTRNTEIVSESAGEKNISTTNQDVVSATAQKNRDFSATEYFEDSELLGAELEARLQVLKAKDESSFTSPSGRIPTCALSLSDQVKALRSGSTRMLVSHLTSSASAPNLSTRIPSSSSRPTSFVSSSQLQGKAPPSSSTGQVNLENSVLAPQSASDPSSSSCFCPCFPSCMKRRRRRKLEGTAGLPSFSHPSPPSGLQTLQTPIPSHKSFRAEEGASAVEEEVEALLESVLEEVRLDREAADWEKDAAAMKENLYGPKILESFSLKEVNVELSRASQQEEILSRKAEKLLRWAKDSASLDQEWAADEEQGSSNGDTFTGTGTEHDQRSWKRCLNGFNGSEEEDDSEGEQDEFMRDKLKQVKREGKRHNSL